MNVHHVACKLESWCPVSADLSVIKRDSPEAMAGDAF
jgi:hypothetical protein